MTGLAYPSAALTGGHLPLRPPSCAQPLNARPLNAQPLNARSPTAGTANARPPTARTPNCPPGQET
ncbi:hypothetical protein SMICM17S_11398 [Streptomyces microflavus]